MSLLLIGYDVERQTEDLWPQTVHFLKQMDKI